MSDSLFAANYELKHIADKDAMFQNPQFTKEIQLIHGGLAHIDAAYDGEDGTAYTIIKKMPDGRIIGFGKRWDKHVDDCLSEIGIYHKRFRAGSISCEKNADKGYLAKELRGLGYTRRVTVDTKAPVISDVEAEATTINANGTIHLTFKVVDPADE